MRPLKNVAKVHIFVDFVTMYGFVIDRTVAGYDAFCEARDDNDAKELVIAE